MANEVQLTIRVGDKGTLDIVAQKAEKAAKSTEKLTESTNKTTAARNRYHKGEKGVASAGANTTKNFSKMNQSMVGSSGLVGAYATLAANVFALTAAFGVLQRTASLAQLKVGFETLANTAGRTSTLVVQSIKDITDGAIAGEAAFSAAAAGFNAGFSQLEIERLTQIAKNASQALGRNLTDSLDRLIRGTAKLEPEILDELGIFVRLDDAVEKYANTLGRSASDLTEAERRQAFLNEALSQGELKFGNLTDSIPANPFDKLAANFEKVSKGFLNIVNKGLGPVIELLASSTTALLGVLIIFGRSMTGAMFPVLDKLGEKYHMLSEASKSAAEQASKDASEMVESARSRVADTDPKNKAERFAKIQQKLAAKEKVSLEELHTAQKSLAHSEKIRNGLKAKYSGDRLKQAEADIASIKMQKQAVEELIAAERGRLGPQQAGKRAVARGQVEEGLSQTISQISLEGPIKGFTTANEKLSEFRANKRELIQTEAPQFSFLSEKQNKILKKLAISFRVGGVAVRLFGAAFLNAIPIIGQVLFVAGLLITGLKALKDAIFPPSRALEQFEEIIGSVEDKQKQLVETNEKLASKYFSVLRNQKMLEAGTKGLTRAQVEQIQQQALSFAEVEAYANTLQVTAGITTEFAGAVDALATELTSLEEPGFLGKLADMVSNKVFEKIEAAIDGVKAKIKELKDLLTDNAIANFLKGFFGDIAEKIKTSVEEAAGPDLATQFDLAPVVSRAREFKTETLSQFEELKEQAPEVAKALTKDLGMPFEEYIDAQLEGIKTSEDYQEAQDRFIAATTNISGVLKAAAVNQTNAADSILKFGDNVNKAQVSLQEFRNKFFQKGEFGKIADEVTSAKAAVKALKETTDAEDGPGFAAAIERAVAAGEINLDKFGLTLQDVKDGGAEAFDGLITKLIKADEETRSLKDKMAALNAELQGIAAAAAFRDASQELNNIREGLAKAGKAEALVGTQLNQLDQKRQDRLNDIKEEKRIKKEIIDAEINLELLKLEILKEEKGLSEKQLALISKMETALTNRRTAEKGLVDTEANTNTTNANIDFLREADSLRSKLTGLATQGESTALIISNLATQFGELKTKGFDALNILDEKGNIIGFNFAGKMALVTGAMQPMIDMFKELGPEGEVANAFLQMLSTMATALAQFGDTLTQVFGVEAFESMETFKAAWDAASPEKKAQAAAAAFSLAAQSIGALGQALAAQAQAAVKNIDDQIAAEKKLDGKSKESLAKIAKLEAKKEQEKKKAFDTDKKIKLASAVMNTAAGIAAALALGPIGMFMVPLIAAMGAAQIAIIAGMSYQGGSSQVSGDPQTIGMGKRKSSIDLARSEGAAGELGYLRGDDGVGGPENFRRGFAGLKYRAEGGNTGIVVGEQGPELFVPNTPGRVVPNDDIAASNQNINFSINTVDAAGVEELLINQRGNIIGMLREASNSYGDPFMEKVNTQIYSSQGGVSRYGER